MPFSIKVSNLDNKSSWEKVLTNEQFQTVKPYVYGFEAVAIIPVPATLKPVRTNNLKNFAKDFFLPTLVNHAIKVQHTIGRIFAILGALILDTLTFPIRLLTCIPTVIINARKEKNPLKNYLVNAGVDPKLLKDDHVRVRLEWEERFHFPTFLDRQPKHWSEQNVNFIEVPTYPGYDHNASGCINLKNLKKQ